MKSSSTKEKNKEPVYKKRDLYFDLDKCPYCGSSAPEKDFKTISSRKFKIAAWCIFALAIIFTVPLLSIIFRGDFSFSADLLRLVICLALWGGFVFLFFKMLTFESTPHHCYSCHKCNNHWYTE